MYNAYRTNRTIKNNQNNNDTRRYKKLRDIIAKKLDIVSSNPLI